MNKFFKTALLAAGLLLTAAAGAWAQSPDDPAPDSPVQIRLPHSARTKENVLDSVLDFTLTQFFKLFKKADVSYDFMEVEQGGRLVFTNFTVVLKANSVQGTVAAQKMDVGFREFLTFVQKNKLMLSQTVLTGVTLDVIVKKGETDSRSIKGSAARVELEKTETAILVKDPNDKEPFKITFASAAVQNARLTATNPAEKYAAESARLEQVALVGGKVSFAAASTGGKSFADMASFLQAVRQ